MSLTTEPGASEAELRLFAALDKLQPADEAYRLAETLKTEGVQQLPMYRLYVRVLHQLEDGDPRYDAVLDTLDCIVGYCSPQGKLFEHYLSNEEIGSNPEE